MEGDRWVCGRLDRGRGKGTGERYGALFCCSFFLLTVLRIAEFQHEVVTYFRILRQGKSFLAYALREAEIG